MELRITLAPDGGIRLILPSRRTLDLGPTTAALRYIQHILRDANSGKRDQRGYIAEFPTQHVIDIWKRQDAEKRLEAEKERFKGLGIDVERLDISL
jgi:hypothetical protein